MAFEGGESSGKSTQALRFAARLGAVFTHEPGGTDLGRRVREAVLDPKLSPLDPRAEALLLAGDRAQHVAQVIRPALQAGTNVVTDRYIGSYLAYQGYGRALDIGELRWLSGWASQGLEPDFVVLLDVPADIARQRSRDAEPDRMEAETSAFHERVRAGFRELAKLESQRWVVVDGVGTVQEVEARVWEAWLTWSEL